MKKLLEIFVLGIEIILTIPNSTFIFKFFDSENSKRIIFQKLL